MIWPHLASIGKIMCIIRYVNAGLFGSSWKMTWCSWQDETGAAGRARFGAYILKHLTFGVWGEHCLDLINNSPTMTTCNDSFYCALVNPQTQLCPVGPSAAHLFLSIFPSCFVKCHALGKLWPHKCGGTVWEWSLALEGVGTAGLKGEQAGMSAQSKQGFCHASSVFPTAWLVCRSTWMHFPPNTHISRAGETPLFSLLSGCGLFLPEKLQTSLSLSLQTSPPAIPSRLEVTARQGHGNSQRAQLLLRDVPLLCPHDAWCHSSLVHCQLW